MDSDTQMEHVESNEKDESQNDDSKSKETGIASFLKAIGVNNIEKTINRRISLTRKSNQKSESKKDPQEALFEANM